MRLIDADKLIKVLNESLEGDVELTKDYELLGIDDFIDAQPTAYDVDKVVEELDTYITKLVGRNSALYQTVIGIVKAGGTKRGGVE